MSVPGVGARLLRQLQQLPAERRVADVIANCFSDPARFPPARLAAEVAELTRRDALDYPAAALVGSIRTLTAETLRAGGGPAWRDAARITAPTLVIYGTDDRAGARADGGQGRPDVRQRADRGDAEHRSRRAHGAPAPGGGRNRRPARRRPDRPSQAGLAREFPLAPAG